MEAVRPSTTVKRPTRELIDDLDLTVGHEVILVTPIKFFGSQRLRELVNVIDRYRVIEIGNTERLLYFFDSRLSRHDQSLLFIDFVVDFWAERSNDRSKLVIEPSCFISWSRDDQWGSRLVDQNRVDLINDGETVTSLDHLLSRAGHVVAKIVKTKFCVCPVGHV